MGNYSTNSFPNNRWLDSDALSNLDDAIQSIDAALRHAFGFSTNSLTPPFDIADDGSIVVQTSIAIGTSNAMIDVVDEIPTTAGANEDQKLAHVDAIRTYLVTQNLPGSQVTLSTTNFDNNLSGADTTVQAALETLDDINIQSLFHYNVSGEFSGVTNESIDALDHIIFEDASDSFSKAYTTVQDFASIVNSVSHNHDDRYYTETEIDTKFSDGTIDHGNLSGLSDNDHPQYLLLSGGIMFGNINIQNYSIKALVSGAPAVDDVLVADTAVDNQLKVGSTIIDLQLKGNATRPEYYDGSTATELTLSSDLDAYLPLTASVSKPLSGDLWLKGANPQVVLNDDGDANDYSTMTDNGVGFYLAKTSASGNNAIVYIEPKVADGTSIADIRMFRATSTTGARALELYVGDGTATVAHQFNCNSGDVDICQQAGELTVGDGTNNVLISPATGVYLTGTATMWEDLRAPAGNLTPGVTSPTWGNFVGNVKTYLFDPTKDEALHIQFQMPHRWAEGTTISPHVHWAPMNTNTGNIKWELEYSWANLDGTFSAPTVITVTDAADGTTSKHQITDFADIAGTGKTMSSMFIARLRRLGTDVADTFTGNAALLEFDIHFQVNSMGSKEEYTKGP